MEYTIGLSIVLFILSILLTLLVKHFTIRKSILDLPNERSSHFLPTPRGGGIAIAITWFLAITYLYIRKYIDSTPFFALLCGLPISVIGLVDDVITISPRVRFFVQVICATIAIFLLGGLNIINIGFQVISFPYLFSIVAVFGIVWFTNLFNFLDGIDGYISAEVIFIGFAFFLLFGEVPPALLAVVTAGFLVWNWQPAKIFMGDVGSTLLGFTMGVFAVYYQNEGVASILIWIMLTSLFWFDATLTLYRRWRNNEKLSQAHRKHAYQRIVQAGFSHQKTVLYGISINFLILLLVLIAIKYPELTLVMLLVNLLLLYYIVRLVDQKFPFQKYK